MADTKKAPAPMVNLGQHSWHDFLETAKGVLSGKRTSGSNTESTSTESGGFSGCNSFQDALRMATEGWQDGAAAMSKSLDALPPALEVLPDWQLDVGGAFPCVPALVAGEPECVWRMNDNIRATRRLTLIVPHSYNCMVAATSAQQYAKGVAALVRSMEGSGIDVQVVAFNTNRSASDRTGANYCYAVTVREFGEPLDLAKVAFAFHSAMLRRIGFAWRECTKAALPIGSGNYGYTQPNTLANVHAVCGEDIGAVCMLPGVADIESDYLRRPDQLPALIERFAKDATAVIDALNAQIGGAL